MRPSRKSENLSAHCEQSVRRLVLIVNLMESGITWDGDLNEELSSSGRPESMPVENLFN